MAKQAFWMTARIVLTVGLLLAAYFYIPTRADTDDSDVPWLILELAVFGVIVGIQVAAIVKARYPVLRAVEALAATIPLFLLIFSRIYLSNSLTHPDSFTQILDHVTALYFTVTVFSTVGFGDIVAATGGMKMLVTVQMLLNLAVLGLVIRLLSSAAQKGVQRRNKAQAAAPITPADPPPAVG
jgi:UDP-N-acetylmuramyl pentapeptide phosphotransferase/UDP-N-acetylglucosamine-1-phosphate transferase